MANLMMARWAMPTAGMPWWAMGNLSIEATQQQQEINEVVGGVRHPPRNAQVRHSNLAHATMANAAQAQPGTAKLQTNNFQLQPSTGTSPTQSITQKAANSTCCCHL